MKKGQASAGAEPSKDASEMKKGQASAGAEPSTDASEMKKGQASAAAEPSKDASEMHSATDKTLQWVNCVPPVFPTPQRQLHKNCIFKSTACIAANSKAKQAKRKQHTGPPHAAKTAVKEKRHVSGTGDSKAKQAKRKQHTGPPCAAKTAVKKKSPGEKQKTQTSAVVGHIDMGFLCNKCGKAFSQKSNLT